jgi:hypothetical protein
VVIGRHKPPAYRPAGASEESTMTKYRWLHRPTDELPGLLVATIGGICFGLLVEKTETGWRLTDSDGTQEDVAQLPDDDEPPPRAA